MKVGSEILDLINSGKSINQIIHLTGRGKSTIYYHYKKLRGRKQKLIEFNFENLSELGEFLGIFAGDGSFACDKNYRYSFRVFIGFYEKQYREYILNKFTKWMGKPPHVYYTKYMDKSSCVTFHYDSKKMYDLIKTKLSWNGKKTYSIRIKNFDLQNEEFNIGFLRGLIDTDGNYYIPKRRLSFSTVSKQLAEQVYKIMLENVKIKPYLMINKKTNRADLYTIYLHGLNANTALSLIKPNNETKRMRQ